MPHYETDARFSARRRFRRQRYFVTATLLLAVLSSALLLAFQRAGVDRPEYETRSDYSHIRIRRNGSMRTLLFVRESGREVIESRVDLDRPQDVQLAYARGMFASYLFRPQQERVLIVGLGGGAMVHFLKHHAPDLAVDVVEIDPVVVKLADQFFRIRSEGKVNIRVADGYEYLRNTRSRYDVIYMDAFLRPSETTDQSGIPARLKTLEFYASMREKLTEDGLVVFNLNTLPETREDIRVIDEAFGQISIFRCPPSRNLVVVASTSTDSPSDEELVERARMLDARFQANFSFSTLLEQRASDY